jgi:hypothetical protein
MSYYVLGERVDLSQSSRGLLDDAVLLMEIQHPEMGSRPAIFLSPVDAAICLQYLNLQDDHGGNPNRYELMIHSSPEVVTTISCSATLGSLPAMVCGFSTNASGQLVIVGNNYSLVQCPFNQDDYAWMFGNMSKPRGDVISMAYANLRKYGADDHRDDINELDFLDPEQLHRIAKIAVAQIGVLPAGQDGGFSVYSPSRPAWRKLL